MHIYSMPLFYTIYSGHYSVSYYHFCLAVLYMFKNKDNRKLTPQVASFLFWSFNRNRPIHKLSYLNFSNKFIFPFLQYEFKLINHYNVLLNIFIFILSFHDYSENKQKKSFYGHYFLFTKAKPHIKELGLIEMLLEIS